VGYWRSVGPSQNTFILEAFIDELAHAAGHDPVEFRRAMLTSDPRLRHVLDVAAERSGWFTPAPEGRARGVALVNDKGGRVAQVAEVSLEDGAVRIHRVTLAADCGQIIHRGIVEQQMVGGVVAGLTAALHGEITLSEGRVMQGNFHDYPMLRMRQMPEVDVHIVESGEEPGGVGEPGVPPAAPAVANALFALTGVRIRRLPIRPESFTADDA
jgi:isoquinoline 1-oxidoreductase subunit beta